MTDELAERRARVARLQAARRAGDADGRRIDIVGTMTEAECREMLRDVLDDISRLTQAIHRAAPGTLVIGAAAIDAAIELLDATPPRSAG